MIERSRERLNYPREWAGTLVEYAKYKDPADDPPLSQWRGRRKNLFKPWAANQRRGSSNSDSRNRSPEREDKKEKEDGPGYRTIQPHELSQKAAAVETEPESESESEGIDI